MRYYLPILVLMFGVLTWAHRLREGEYATESVPPIDAGMYDRAVRMAEQTPDVCEPADAPLSAGADAAPAFAM